MNGHEYGGTRNMREGVGEYPNPKFKAQHYRVKKNQIRLAFTHLISIQGSPVC
jgi:hypothetical protein